MAQEICFYAFLISSACSSYIVDRRRYTAPTTALHGLESFIFRFPTFSAVNGPTANLPCFLHMVFSDIAKGKILARSVSAYHSQVGWVCTIERVSVSEPRIVKLLQKGLYTRLCTPNLLGYGTLRLSSIEHRKNLTLGNV